MYDSVNPLTDEEEALYDMSDEQFEEALASARAEQEQGDIGDDIIGDQNDANSDENETTNITGSEPAEDDVNSDKSQDNDVADDEHSKELEQSTTDSNTDGNEDNGTDPAEADADKTEANDVDKSEPEDTKPQTYKYNANGQEFEFTEAEIKERFGQVFGQSMNYTQKMQEIKPWRTTISALEDNKISHSDIELMIDVMKGDKGAINKLMQKVNIDPMELDVDSEDQVYQPQQYGQSEVELEINDIVNEIGRDPEYAITQDVLSNRWDQSSRDAFLDNPSLIKKLHIDVKSGDFDVLSAEATKLKLYDGNRLSDIEYYAQAAQRRAHTIQNQNIAKVQNDATEQARLDGANAEAKRQAEANAARIAEVKAQQEKQKQVEADANGRKNAAIPSKSAGNKTVVDYLDDDDESFNEWYKNLEASL